MKIKILFLAEYNSVFVLSLRSLTQYVLDLRAPTRTQTWEKCALFNNLAFHFTRQIGVLAHPKNLLCQTRFFLAVCS